MNLFEQTQKLKPLTQTNTLKQADLVEETKSPSEDRMSLLSDGIFAIAVTLLVLDIKIPLDDTHASTPQAHAAFIQALTGDFLSDTLFYIITFAVLASYWLSHRRLTNVIQRVDKTFLWLNLVFLAFVAFVPIATNVSKYSQFPEAVIVYTVVLAGCGYSALLLWIYALGNNRLVSVDIDKKSVRYRLVGTALTPTSMLLSLLLLFIPNFTPSHVFFSWFLLPFISLFWNLFWARRDKSESEEELAG
jgi:uncharacterized membrane protein